VLLVLAFVVVLVAATWALNLLIGYGVAGVIVALVLAGAAALASYWKADAVALVLSHARPADPVEYARLHNIVEGLCIAGGLPKPRVYVIDDAAPNAFATGRNPRHAAVAVTTGLLENMTRVELEGVIAHELSHVKNYDILVSTLAVTLVGIVVPPLVQLAVSRRRESLADVSGVALTRYPPGLTSALEKLQAHTAVVRSSSRATAHLWIESPIARRPGEGRSSWLNRLFDTHPPLDERIKALREL